MITYKMIAYEMVAHEMITYKYIKVKFMNTTLKNETADIYDKVICVTNRHLCKESLPKQLEE